MGITGFLAFLNSQYVVSDLAGQLQNEVSDRIVQHLDTYLKTPHLVNHLCQDSIRLGEINIHDNEGLRRHFQEMSYRYGSVEAICYANEQEGNYTIISLVGAPGIANGTDRFWGVSQESTNFTFEEYLVDRNGRIKEKTLSKPQYDPRTRPWYQAAVQARGQSWTPIYMWLEGVVSQDAVVPVYSDNNELLGVLDTSLTLTGIGDFLQNLQISKHGQAFIIERSGLLVASSTIHEPYTRVNGELVRISALDCNNTVIQSTTRYLNEHFPNDLTISSRQQFSFDMAGAGQLVQVSPYQDQYGLDWLIVVVIPESDFMEKINVNSQITVLLILFSIIGTIIISILLAGWITWPIISMNHSARALAHGDWTSFKELDRRDELGELSHSFKKMADQLRATFSSLKSSEERYVHLFQSSADAILLFDTYSLVQMNRAGEEMFAISYKEAKGKDVRTLFGEIGNGIGDMIDSSLSSDDNGYIDNTISQTINGTELFMNIRLTRVPVDNKVLSLVHIRDITDQRLAIIASAEQKALRESYYQIQTILQLLPDPTLVIDSNGNVLFWNKALEKLTGVMSDKMIGTGDYAYSEAIYPSIRPILIDFALHPEKPYVNWYPSIEQDGEVLRSITTLEKYGETRYYSVIAARLYDKNGEVIGAIESIRDITSHKIAEEALLIANKKLNLLSSITRHDILNKITITRAHVSLLEDSGLNEEAMISVDAIKRSTAEIEHFIAFTKIYQEIGVQIPIWQDAGETFNTVITGMQTGDLVINNEVTNISILVDPLFEKVCYNLIENAVRHGENLTRIDIISEETEEGVRISVVDDGCGVSEDLKEKIFERGYGKNTGYGLFLSREILSLSGITITERGRYGAGCRFDIDVPRGKFRKKPKSG